ncbi:MAG: DUF4097 family beta strand repeat-containing protein [Bacillota bacterium]|jgi:DUF4097 and DUF4098 domain-containing protein YvlB
MADEQLLILKMLEEGKITAEQAAELLSLVGKRPAKVGAQRQSPHLEQTTPVAPDAEQERYRQLSKQVREEERQARRQIKREAKRAAAEIKSLPQSDRLGKSLHKSLQMLGISLGGSRSFTFTKDLDGTFSVHNPEIGIQNTNGHVRIGHSEDERWHLKLSARVRADSAAVAKELSDGLVIVSPDSRGLRVESRRFFGQNAVVDIELNLPRQLQPQITVSCTNGTVNLIGIQGERAKLHTVNGKIRAEGFRMEHLEAHAVNGGIQLQGFGEQLECRAANGRLQLALSSAERARLELETVNGSIELALPPGNRVGYQVSASSTVGNIQVDLPDLQWDEKSRPGRRKLEASSRDLVSKEQVQSIRAKTVSGTIRIHLGEGLR